MPESPTTDLSTEALRRATTVLAGLALAATLTAGCGENNPLDPNGGSDGGDSPPRQAPSSDLTFLRQSSDAPPLLLGDSDGDGLGDTTFVATRGEDLDVEIYYEDADEPGTQGDRFLEFELDDESLLRYPDDHPRAGDRFRAGDQVTITLQVAGDTILADFQPSGLQFNPDEPAELEMRWSNADRDLDDDGEDDLDEREDEIDVWKQEQPNADWIQEQGIEDLELDRIEAELESFTRWALAV